MGDVGLVVKAEEDVGVANNYQWIDLSMNPTSATEFNLLCVTNETLSVTTFPH